MYLCAAVGDGGEDAAGVPLIPEASFMVFHESLRCLYGLPTVLRSIPKSRELGMYLFPMWGGVS